MTFLSTLKKAATVAGDVLNSKGDLLSRNSTVLARLAVGSDGKVLTAKASEATGLSWETPSAHPAFTQSFVLACSDETTDLTTGTKLTFRMPYAFTVSEVRASLTTAGTGGTLVTVDINEGGTTILSTQITIDASETTSEDASTPPVINDPNLADDAEMTIDIDNVGSTNTGKGLKVYIIGVKA